MTDTVRVNATMDTDLLRRIDSYAERHLEDRSTAIRQLTDFALRTKALQDALSAYAEGRVTLREFARTLAVDTWTAHDLLRANGVAVAQGAAVESQTDLDEIVEQLSDP